MELTYWWILPLAAAAVAASCWRLVRAGRKPANLRPVAHRERLTSLPEYQQAVRRHRRWLTVATAAGALLLAATATAAARPVDRGTSQPEVRNRDIILCLDVSGSMGSTDAAIAAVFEKLAKKFNGERIGMVIFDSSAVQLFPLTDDYSYVAEQLETARKAFDGDASGSFFDGTGSGEGSSLIGDGLASCVQSFPGLDNAGRPRSIILATDNYVSGKPIFTLEQAAQLAKPKSIKINALNPGDYDHGEDKAQPGAMLRAVAEASGGSYFALDSPDAVPGIVQKVQEGEGGILQRAPQAAISDNPVIPLSVALLAGGVLLLAGWRLES